MKRTILFYDRSISGHHLEYIRYLVTNASRYPELKMLFLIAGIAVENLVGFRSDQVHFITVPPLKSSNLLSRTFEEGGWLTKVQKQQGVTDIFFLAIDQYQHLIGSWKYTGVNCGVHGILFSPPHRLYPAPDSELIEKVSQWGRRLRKTIQLYWMLRNSKVESLFVLDDPKGATILNQWFRNIFSYLPDPIEHNLIGYERGGGTSSNSCKTLLAFGTINRRKNLKNIILSLEFCQEDKIELLIVGSGDPSLVQELREVAKVYDKQPNISVIFDIRFVPDQEMEDLFARADVIVMVYRNFYGSSGILGRAAKYNKPVLVSNEGLVAAITRDYGLGECVNGDSRSIGQGITKILKGIDEIKNNAPLYLQPKTVVNFTDVIFKRLAYKV